MGEEFKYWVFVSYSSKDKAWSAWLHRQLDRYRPPRRCVGRASPDGRIPERMLPAFRDREELAGSPSLGDSLNASLRASQYLVVVCTPNSAASTHVNDEVKYFKSLGREERVYCFIAGGSPSATDHTCCYPPAVRQKYDRNGQLTSEIAHPLASDARPHGDGRRNARTKLIAGLLGVDYDELERREWWRTFWKGVRLGAAAITAIAVVGVLGKTIWSSRIESLTDLGRKELLEGNAVAALRSLSGAYSLAGDTSTLALRFLLHQAKLAMTSEPGGELRGNVWTARFNREGTRVVTAASDPSAIVWDSTTGQVVQILVGHEADKCINLASFSPDGKTVVTACDDGTARIWSVEQGNSANYALDVRAHTNGAKVFPALFNPKNANQVVTGCSDGDTALIWDLATHQPMGARLKHTGTNLAPQGLPMGLHFATFSPDGALIVTAGLDGMANIWDASTGSLIKPLRHEAALRYAVFSPDSARIVTCGYHGEARLWTRDGQLIKILPVEPKDNTARRAAFSSDGKILVVTSSVGTPTVYSGETGDFLFRLNCPEPKATYCVAINKAGLIAVGGAGGLMVWDAGYHLLRIEGGGHHGTVYGLEFSEADDNRLASSGSDGKAYVWDVSDRNSVRQVCALNNKASVGTNYMALSGHSGWVMGVVSERTGRYIMTVDSSNALRGWEQAKEGYQKLSPFPMGAEPVASVAFDSTGKLLVVGEGKKTEAVTIWDVEKRTKVAVFDFGGDIEAVDFAPGSERVIVKGTMLLAPTIVMADFSPAQKGRVIFSAATMPAFSRSGDKFVVVNQHGIAEVRRTSDGKKVAEFGSNVKTARFCADDNRILTVNTNKSATIWAVDRASPIMSFGPGRIEFAAVNSDGSRIVTLREGRHAAAIWDAANGSLLFELEGDDQNYEVSATFGRPLFAEFSHDGALVITQAFTNSVGIWDARTGKLLRRTVDHRDKVTAVAFSADRTKLLTGAQDTIVQVTDVSYETETPAAIASLVRIVAHKKVDVPTAGKSQ